MGDSDGEWAGDWTVRWSYDTSRLRTLPAYTYSEPSNMQIRKHRDRQTTPTVGVSVFEKLQRSLHVNNQIMVAYKRSTQFRADAVLSGHLFWIKNGRKSNAYTHTQLPNMQCWQSACCRVGDFINISTQINSEKEKYTMGIFAAPATILLDTRTRRYCRVLLLLHRRTTGEWREKNKLRSVAPSPSHSHNKNQEANSHTNTRRMQSNLHCVGMANRKIEKNQRISK